MGEILSNDTLNLLKNTEVQKGIRTLVESESPHPGVPVKVTTPQGDTSTVTLKIASS